MRGVNRMITFPFKLFTFPQTFYFFLRPLPEKRPPKFKSEGPVLLHCSEGYIDPNLPTTKDSLKCMTDWKCIRTVCFLLQSSTPHIILLLILSGHYSQPPLSSASSLSVSVSFFRQPHLSSFTSYCNITPLLVWLYLPLPSACLSCHSRPFHTASSFSYLSSDIQSFFLAILE